MRSSACSGPSGSRRMPRSSSVIGEMVITALPASGSGGPCAHDALEQMTLDRPVDGAERKDDGHFDGEEDEIVVAGEQAKRRAENCILENEKDDGQRQRQGLCPPSDLRARQFVDRVLELAVLDLDLGLLGLDDDVLLSRLLGFEDGLGVGKLAGAVLTFDLLAERMVSLEMQQTLFGITGVLVQLRQLKMDLGDLRLDVHRFGDGERAKQDRQRVGPP